MKICHCAQITDRDIDAAIDWMRASDPDVVITPGKIFHALGKSADCGGCIRLFVSTMKRNGNLAVPNSPPDLRTPARLRDVSRRDKGEKP
jgi:bacterioferritin-associated ferredoxin